MIPSIIQRKHVLRAIKEIERNAVPPKRRSIRYDVLHKRRRFPPKYTIGLAKKYANGNELDYRKFSGGAEANLFLDARGFQIVDKGAN